MIENCREIFWWVSLRALRKLTDEVFCVLLRIADISALARAEHQSFLGPVHNRK